MQAVAEQLSQGHSFSLPHPLEVELAERLTRLIPCAEKVRFGKNGSDATSGACVRPRFHWARTHRLLWLPWLAGLVYRQHHAKRRRSGGGARPDASLRLQRSRFLAKASRRPSRPVCRRDHGTGKLLATRAGFLEGVKSLAHEHGALLIFDEICSGFHFGLGGAQKKFGVIPDMACFGKAMGNGFPIACVVGRSDVMKVFEDIFFSFTFGGEVASMAAAMKVLDVLEPPTRWPAWMRMVGCCRRDSTLLQSRPH